MKGDLNDQWSDGNENRTSIVRKIVDSYIAKFFCVIINFRCAHTSAFFVSASRIEHSRQVNTVPAFAKISKIILSV